MWLIEATFRKLITTDNVYMDDILIVDKHFKYLMKVFNLINELTRFYSYLRKYSIPILFCWLHKLGRFIQLIKTQRQAK